MVDDGASARAFYTAVSTPDFGIGRVRVARPTDASWDAWEKGDVVVEAPEGLELVAYRDPFIRREGDRWRMFIGAAGVDGTAMALTYVSHDLDTWAYDGVALERHSSERDPVWMGALWECPQVFTIDGHDVMLSSIWDADELHYAAYAAGTFRDGRFHAERWGRLTWGASYYAPSLFTDKDGEAAVTFWLRGIRGDGWAGAHSIPFRLHADAGALIARPHPDVAAHRTPRAADGRVTGLVADIEWSAPDGALDIRSGGQPLVTITRDGDEVSVDTSGEAVRVPVAGPVRIIVDGPILEVCSDGGIYACAVSPAGQDLAVTAAAETCSVYGLVR
ncbi:MAG: glycoside hydrolase family 32 protein [Microbacterium sp.]|nr:MAG: glycoside hydrolase family 32 protein [Microbacterium sp.]